MRNRRWTIASDLEPFPLAIALYDAVREASRAPSGLYLDRRGRRKRPAHLWPFCNLFHALCTLAELAGDKDLVADTVGLGLALACYRRPAGGRRRVRLESAPVPPFGKGGDAYYDDNAWAGLCTVALFELTGEVGWLELSRGIWNFVRQGWSRDPALAHPGGVRWAEPAWSVSRHAVSTGAGCELALELFRHTGETGYLDEARKWYQWLRDTLLDDDGLCVDKISPSGRRDGTRWACNQGLLVGAAARLSIVTGEPHYGDEAANAARSGLSWYRGERLVQQGPAFSAIFFRNLLLVETTRTEARAALEGYLDEVNPDLKGRRRFVASELNAVAPLIELFALLGGGIPRP